MSKGNYRKPRWHLYIADKCMGDLCNRKHTDTYGMSVMPLAEFMEEAADPGDAIEAAMQRAELAQDAEADIRETRNG